ncbi:hypothetical protein HG15A2_13810 [Adhaeretor mobilis]|uniref:Uncharacterized protein n=1 Tax=Adhaeretor mobilis TaxID=1930276 RepID=A0A517MTA5_9BACT|nr:hypothetical protein HG15A2_13810 [Adhaeretor mobilis]
MRRSTFHFFIAVCAGWAALSIPSLVGLALPAIQIGDLRATRVIVGTVGVLLLPIASVGLWREQLWGLSCLLVGFITVLVTIPSASYLHAVCLAVTLVRYLGPRE